MLVLVPVHSVTRVYSSTLWVLSRRVQGGLGDLYWSDVLDLVNSRGCPAGIVIKNSLSSRVAGRLCLTLSGARSDLKLFSVLSLGSLLTILSVAPLLSPSAFS